MLLCPVKQQKTKSHWTNTIDLSLENILCTGIPMPLPRSKTYKFEDEINPSTLAQKSTPVQPNALKRQSRSEPVPILPSILPVNRLPLVNKKLDVSALKSIPAVLTNPVLEKLSKNGDIEVLSGLPSPVESNYDSTEVHPAEAEESEVDPNEPKYLESICVEDMKKGENNALAKVYDELQEKYDQIMTGWNAVVPTAGNKCNCSPDDQMSWRKRGRRIKRIDYYSLYHGKAAKKKNDAKTRTEAISVHANE